MKLYTISISHHRVATSFGIPMLDTTVKSGDAVFAPTWEIVTDVKSGRITETQYTNAYLQLMRNSWLVNRYRWKEVCEMDKVAIACYCSHGKFCHRHLLAGMLEKACHYFDIGFTHMGELKGVKPK